MEATIMMISRSGDILEILISMHLSKCWLKYVKSASYQHNTTDTNNVTHDIVRNLANFNKMNKKEHAPLRSNSTCNDLYKQEVL